MEEKTFRARILPDVMVCVEQVRDAVLSGRVLFPYKRYPVPFENAADLIMKIDRMFVQAETAVRENRELFQYHSFKDFSGISQEKAVFFLRILYRRNENMQGTFFSGKLSHRPATFRSTMELAYYLRELTEVLEEGEKHV